jgi:hypothetical protein
VLLDERQPPWISASGVQAARDSWIDLAFVEANFGSGLCQITDDINLI